MNSSFVFSMPQKIVFGAGKFKNLPGYISGFGRRVILLTGSASFVGSAHWEYLTKELKKMNVHYDHATISHEPSPQLIDELTTECRTIHPSVVVAIGGGSVLDAGKAISAMILTAGSVIDYLEGFEGSKKHKGTKIPFIAVPTTSGTGSEATKNAVLSEPGENGYKRSLRHDNFIPNLSLVDPVLTLSCPAGITAASGMDAFTQLVESYLSVKSTNLTDCLALEGIRSIKKGLLQVVENGKNLEARTHMSYSALLSGITLANAGLGVVHGFASAMGGKAAIPHGIICGTLMASANRKNLNKLKDSRIKSPVIYKYAHLGRIFLDAETEKINDDFYAEEFVSILEQWTEKLKLPRLSDLKLTTEELEQIASATAIKNNPVDLNPKDLLDILHARM